MLTCSRLRKKIELADDIKAVAAMSVISAADEVSSTSSSTSTLVETLEDDTAVDVVTDTATTQQVTVPATVVAPPVTAERRRCKEPTAAVEVLPDADKSTSKEAMISPNTKVELHSSRKVCLKPMFLQSLTPQRLFSVGRVGCHPPAEGRYSATRCGGIV